MPGIFYVNSKLKELMFEELQQYCTKSGYGGFLPAMKQISNVAALPGIVKVRAATAPVCQSTSKPPPTPSTALHRTA